MCLEMKNLMFLSLLLFLWLWSNKNYVQQKNFNLIFTIWMVRTIPLILHYFSQLRNSNNIVFVVLAAREHLVNTLKMFFFF